MVARVAVDERIEAMATNRTAFGERHRLLSSRYHCTTHFNVVLACFPEVPMINVLEFIG
jgi:hypothetical protein